MGARETNEIFGLCYSAEHLSHRTALVAALRVSPGGDDSLDLSKSTSVTQ